MVSPRPHRVIVVGGGFGGLQAATHLTAAPVELTLVDRRNFHLFQPLTYQVATGALSPGEVCYPLRAIFRRHRNVRVVLGEVAGFDLDRRRLDVRPVVGEGVTRSLEYDTLIVAGGSYYSYFGHDECATRPRRSSRSRARSPCERGSSLPSRRPSSTTTRRAAVHG